jgi:hypothetical protein
MLNPKIKTHKLGVTYSQPHFFILNKGRNAGKPSPDWFSNSFVFLYARHYGKANIFIKY